MGDSSGGEYVENLVLRKTEGTTPTCPEIKVMMLRMFIDSEKRICPSLMFTVEEPVESKSQSRTVRQMN